MGLAGLLQDVVTADGTVRILSLVVDSWPWEVPFRAASASTKPFLARAVIDAIRASCSFWFLRLSALCSRCSFRSMSADEASLSEEDSRACEAVQPLWWVVGQVAGPSQRLRCPPCPVGVMSLGVLFPERRWHLDHKESWE